VPSSLSAVATFFQASSSVTTSTIGHITRSSSAEGTLGDEPKRAIVEHDGVDNEGGLASVAGL
jgi:hypothetical protein